MGSYKILNKQKYFSGDYSIIPIRDIDKFIIMKWRNEQMYHLRQSEKLNEKIQTKYFKDVISPLFISEFPPQILFSFMENNECIGYSALEFFGFNKETVLKNHCLIENNFIDVVIHSKFNKNTSNFFKRNKICL